MLKNSCLELLSFCEGNPPVTGGFPSQMDSNLKKSDSRFLPVDSLHKWTIWGWRIQIPGFYPPAINRNRLHASRVNKFGWQHDYSRCNKANLRDLTAATSLVIFLKLHPNRWFFGLWDLEIWQMNSSNNRVPLLCYIKLCASFRSHWWIQTGVTVQKCSIRVKIVIFFVMCDLEIWHKWILIHIK